MISTSRVSTESVQGNVDSSVLAGRVLIVDDEPAAAQVIARYLEQLGYEVDFAYSATDAMERLSLNPFDLIISDVRMSQGTGIDLLRELRTIKNDHIPVILMSAETRGAKAQAQALGADAFIEKPVDRNQLAQTLGDLLL